MIYALTNPVKDPLVEHVWEWPGVNSYGATVDGTTLTATRPAHFFRKDGTMPEVATLTIARPQGFEKMSAKEFAALIKARVAAAEKSAAADRRAKGINVLGRERILKQDWRARPKSAEPHFKLSPRVAAKNKWARIEAITRNTDFLAAYFAAKDEFAQGFTRCGLPRGHLVAAQVREGALCEGLCRPLHPSREHSLPVHGLGAERARADARPA
jgi:putative transposase